MTANQAVPVKKWAVFFVLAYVVQGFAQTTGILFQPLQYFLKAEHGYTASQLAAFTFWVTFPWYIKPVYGLLSDFVPLLGYRRRSYLVISCFLSFVAFTLVLGITDPRLILYALILTAICTAFGDVMVDALMVEKGQAANKITLFQGLQWTSISAIGILAAVGGGLLAQFAKNTDEPIAGVRIAAMIALIGPTILLFATWFIVKETKSGLDKQGLQRAGSGFAIAMKSKPLLGVVLFVCLFWFQPGLIAPMYIFCTEDLGISEAFYGSASAWTQGGYMIGAVLFLFVLSRRFSTRQLAVLSICLYAGSTFTYLGLVGPKSLVALSVLYGVCYMISNLTLLSLAAQVCPRYVEAFVFAFLMGLFNFVKQGSEWIGGEAYDRLVASRTSDEQSIWSSIDLSSLGLSHPIHPLIVASGTITLLAFVFVPLLPKAIPAAEE
ncbi:MAG: MFS transporter [Phycisphaeraceae bacterium]